MLPTGSTLMWTSLLTLTVLEVMYTMGMARVLAAPRTPTKAERKEHDVSHVPGPPLVSILLHRRGLERRHLTQSGAVFADCGCTSGDSTPLLGVKRQTQPHDVCCSLFDEWRC